MKFAQRPTWAILTFFALIYIGTFIFSSSVHAAGTNYYIDSIGGSDSNNGTSSSTPWQTLAQVNSSVFNPGDSVLFKAGDTWSGGTLTVPSSGTSGNPITFGSYGSGAMPIIDSSVVQTGWIAENEGSFTAYYVSAYQPYVVTSDGQMLWQAVVSTTTTNPPFVSLSALTPGHYLYDSGTNRVYIRLSDDSNPSGHVIRMGQTLFTVVVDGKPYIKLQGLQISGANYDCIRAEDGSDHIQIIGDVIKNCGYEGTEAAVFIDGAASALIQNNTVDYGGYFGIYISGYNGADDDSAVISGNTINNIGYDCIQIGPQTTGSVNNVLVQNNDVSYCGQIRMDSAGIDSYYPGVGTVYRYNRVHNGGTAVSYSVGMRFDTDSTDETAYGNVVFLNSSGCIQLTGSTNYVYNNTCYHNNELAGFDFGELNLFGYATDEIVKNNIFVPSVGKHATVIDDNTIMPQEFDHNLYSATSGASVFNWLGTDYTFANWQIVSGQDASSPPLANPAFTNAGSNNFTLTSISPAIDMGNNLGVSYQNELNSNSSWPGSINTLNENSYGSGWDLGAYVYTQTSTPSVVMTAPASSTISGVVAVSASSSAALPASISSVQFYLDGSPLGSPVTSTSSPNTYIYSWNTASSTNASHSIYALATDNYGNMASSPPVTVTVANNLPSPLPPPVTVAVAAGYAPTQIASGSTTSTSTLSVTISSSTIQAASSASASFLQAELKTLLAELTSLESQTETPAAHTSSSNAFTRSLSYGMTGVDVTALQTYLTAEDEGPAAQKLKSHGTTAYFGILTYHALVELQKAAGITPASGFFGPITRAWLNGH